jgi:hypothetical protein
MLCGWRKRSHETRHCRACPGNPDRKGFSLSHRDARAKPGQSGLSQGVVTDPTDSLRVQARFVLIHYFPFDEFCDAGADWQANAEHSLLFATAEVFASIQF